VKKRKVLCYFDRWTFSRRVSLWRRDWIKDLVDVIVKFTLIGKVLWDKMKPDGQPRRMLDISKAEREFDFKPNTCFEIGLRQTIKWYPTGHADHVVATKK